MTLPKLTVLVTGGAGFIGSHLVARLTKRGHVVYSIDKSSGTSTADFANLTPFVTKGLDRIVHLGANCSSQVSIRDPHADFTDNVVGTFNVCEFARRSGSVPIIFNSSMKVYPGDDGLVPPYGLSKRVGEMYIREYLELYGVPFVINRPSSVYGPQQRGSEDGGWVTWFIRASITHQPITLFGDGNQSRDALYIGDHVDLLVEEVEKFEVFKNQTFDVGGGSANEVSLLELLEFLGYTNFSFAPRLPGDVERFVCDNEGLAAYTSWAPKVGWKAGVRRTREYLQGAEGSL